jgi:hypothetical protein
MNINRILSASILAGSVLLSGTACTANSTPEPSKPTASTQTTADATTDNASEINNVLATVNGYYSFIAAPENYDRVKTAGAELTGKEASDEQLSTMASNFEGFQYFDTSNSQLIKNAYKAMMLGSGSLRMGSPVEITAPADAVTVDGDKAALNTTWITVTESGVDHPTKPESNPDPSDVINLVKKDNGSWVIVAKDSSMKVSAP